MALRDIMVCLDATAASDRRCELALNLALANRAHLTAAYALPKPRGSAAPPAGAGLPPTVLSPVSPDGAGVIGGLPPSATPEPQTVRETERADAAEQRFREMLPQRGLDGDWHIVDDADPAEVIELAKPADLAILGQYPGDHTDGRTWLRPDHVIIAAGRPVLVVPDSGVFASVGSRVLVAWDGTRECNRALNDALALIGNAEAVTVMHVGEGSADLDLKRLRLERIARHLNRHGIKTKLEESPSAGIPIADVLLSRAADLGADMIVAGGYHHTHLREALLGGVSRDLLDRMTVPVLMSH